MYRFRIFFLLIALVCLISCSASDDNDPASNDSSEDLTKKFVEMVKIFNVEKKKLKSDKEKLKKMKENQQTSISRNDIIRLNVGGEIIITTRASLTHLPSSIFGLLLNGRWEQNIVSDFDNNYFLDLNPDLFRHLLEQMRRIKKDQIPIFSPPYPSSISVRQSYQKMLKKLHLTLSPSPPNNPVIAMNIGGQSMLTRQNKLKQLNLLNLLSRSADKKFRSYFSASQVFIDADPELFHHVMNQIRTEDINIQNTPLKAPSHEQISAFNRMLEMLGFSARMLTKTTTTTIAPLPQCSTYTTIQDETRLIDHITTDAPVCDSSEFTSITKWVRFISPGGTRLATTATDTNRCNTHATGWYKGLMPPPGATVNGTVCYHWDGDPCRWQNSIEVTNCGAYYVFGLIEPPNCTLRYCTIAS